MKPVRTLRHSQGMTGRAGMTLFEVLIAVFVLMVGLVGVLAAIPTGVTSAEWIVFQDAAIHLSRSKFSEFRRDRVDPAVDLKEGSSYMTKWQEPLNPGPGGFHSFASGMGKTYQYFDGIERYEWKVDQDILAKPVGAGTSNPAPVAGYYAPELGGGTPIGLHAVVLTIHQRGTTRELQFTQYMTSYGRIEPVDPKL